MLKTFKVELKPNNKQRSRLLQSAATARWAYNWALVQSKEDLKLSYRTYNCSECGMTMDRDLNAEINLMQYGRREMLS